MKTPKIGSAKMAKAIATFRPRFYEVQYSILAHKYTASKEYLDNTDELPEGWTYLGHGATRIAFLGPDGVVYKRGYDRPQGWTRRASGNTHCEREADSYLDLVNRFAENGIHIPACRWYRSVKVLAMEHVTKGRDFLPSDGIHTRTNGTGFYDVHTGNIWWDKQGRLVCVDYA